MSENTVTEISSPSFFSTKKFLPSLTAAFVVFAVSLYFFVDGLDNRPFFTRGEGREALVVRDMISHSNLVLPFDDRSDIPTKPPMFHWLGVISSHLFPGPLDEGDIRFPSAFSGALALAVMIFATSRWSGLGNGLILGAILGTSSEWMRSAGHARVDMCFCLWVTLGLLSLFRIVTLHRNSQQGDLPWWMLTTASLGAAILSKGPAGLVIPWMVAIGYLFLITKLQPTKNKISSLFVPAVISVLGSALLAGVWYFLAYQQGGDAFVKVHLFKENIGRFTLIDGADQGHVKPIYFSILYLLIGFVPWSILLPLVCVWLWKNRKTFVAPGREFLLFSIVWTAVVLGIVSISQSKRDVYLLPAFPALAYISMFVLKDLREKNLSARKTEQAFGIFMGLLAFVALVVTISGGYLNEVEKLPGFLSVRLTGKVASVANHLLDNWINSNTLFIPLILATGALFSAAWASWKGRVSTIVATVGASSALVTILVNHLIFPAIAAVESPRDFIASVTETVDEATPLYQYKTQFFPAMYYADRRVTLVMNLDQFDDNIPAYLLVREREVPEVQQLMPEAKIVLTSDNYAANGEGHLYLFSNSAEQKLSNLGKNRSWTPKLGAILGFI